MCEDQAAFDYVCREISARYCEDHYAPGLCEDQCSMCDNVITSCGQALYAMKILKTRSTTRVFACPLPVHHLVTAHVCISSVVRICEWGGCWEIGLVHTKISQVVFRIAGSVTVIPTRNVKREMTFCSNQFVQTETMFLRVSFLQSRKQATISGPELMTLSCPVLRQTNWLTKISSIESFSKTCIKNNHEF